MCRPERTAAKDMPSHRHEQRHTPVNLFIVASNQNVQCCVLREDHTPHHGGIEIRFSGAKSESLPEEYKAWSQNLGHENVLTTFSSYGDVARHRQAEIIRSLGKSEQHAC